MKLNFEQIKSITTGAKRIYEENSLIHFRRFNKQQEMMYKDIGDFAYGASLSSAGIKLSFITDSTKMLLDFEVVASVRDYYSFDIFVNDNCIGYIDNFTEPMPVFYGEQKFESKECRKEFNIGKGEKKITVHLPWSAITALRQMQLDDGAKIIPFKYDKKILFLGDSITHGVDCLRPSNRYSAKLCEALYANEFNMARAGDIFIPKLLSESDMIFSDLAIVAYGTNDWSGYDRETVQRNCEEFLSLLKQKLPHSEIFVISPIWRKDTDEKRKYGQFSLIGEDIEKITKKIGEINFINGYGLVPRDERFFGDGRLHPNDNGFQIYFENLYRKIGELR